MAVDTRTSGTQAPGTRPGARCGTRLPEPDDGCVCPRYHEAIELIGRRWSGAILQALTQGPMRFSQISAAVPDVSDRLLSERLKELEARGVVTRDHVAGPPPTVHYCLTRMGGELGPALAELQRWARRWL